MGKEELDSINQNDPISRQNQNTPAKQIRLSDEGIRTQYANVFNIGFGQEEVIFLFGNPSIDPRVVRIESKTAVSIKTAKRIALTLGNMLRRYEAINGKIDISAPKAAAGEKTKIQ